MSFNQQIKTILLYFRSAIITVNAKEAIIYESCGAINQLQTSNILETLPGLRIIAVFYQVSNLYVAPNYQFLYNRPIRPQQFPMPTNVDQPTQIGMMHEDADEWDTLDVILDEITPVSQIGQSAINYANLTSRVHSSNDQSMEVSTCLR